MNKGTTRSERRLHSGGFVVNITVWYDVMVGEKTVGGEVLFGIYKRKLNGGGHTLDIARHDGCSSDGGPSRGVAQLDARCGGGGGWLVDWSLLCLTKKGRREGRVHKRARRI